MKSFLSLFQFVLVIFISEYNTREFSVCLCIFISKYNTCEFSWWFALESRECLEGYVSFPRMAEANDQKCSCRKSPTSLLRMGWGLLGGELTLQSSLQATLHGKSLAGLSPFSVLLPLSLTSSFTGNASLINHLHMNLCLSVCVQRT